MGGIVAVSNTHPRYRFSVRETQQTIQLVLKTERQRAFSLSVVFVASRFMRKINHQYLGHDGNTDVMSFPLADGIGFDAELYVNLDRARSQARQYRVSYREEVRRLLIHGTLHLVGYDDTTPRERKRMRQREEFYLAQFIHRGS